MRRIWLAAGTLALLSSTYAAAQDDDAAIIVTAQRSDSELYWQQASETEVFLYIEHNVIIRPR